MFRYFVEQRLRSISITENHNKHVKKKGLMQLFSLGLVFRPNLLLVFISKVRLEYDCCCVGTTLEGQKNLTRWS